LNSVTLLMEFP